MNWRKSSANFELPGDPSGTRPDGSGLHGFDCCHITSRLHPLPSSLSLRRQPQCPHNPVGHIMHFLWRSAYFLVISEWKYSVLSTPSAISQDTTGLSCFGIWQNTRLRRGSIAGLSCALQFCRTIHTSIRPTVAMAHAKVLVSFYRRLTNVHYETMDYLRVRLPGPSQKCNVTMLVGLAIRRPTGPP